MIDPDLDQKGQKAPDPGSGSATLHKTLHQTDRFCFFCIFLAVSRIRDPVLRMKQLVPERRRYICDRQHKALI